MTKILFSKANGPYTRDFSEMEVTRLSDFVSVIRGHFEDRADAVAVVRNGSPVAMWIAEPDIECDSDGCYEVSPAYPGQEYCRYTSVQAGFQRNYIHYFGIRYFDPSAQVCSAPLAGRDASQSGIPDGEASLTPAERNPSMLRR